jgi:hypothetical protein
MVCGRLPRDRCHPLRFLLKIASPLLQRTAHVGGVAPQKTGNLRRLISLLQHGRLDKTASHFTDGSALSPSCHSLRFQPSRPEAWTRGWRGMSRHYHNERKYRKFSDTAPVRMPSSATLG